MTNAVFFKAIVARAVYLHVSARFVKIRKLLNFPF